MDGIDITDSAFSLEIPNVNTFVSTEGVNDYSIIIYIGIAILVAFIGMFTYKFYTNNKNVQGEESDCPGGFCTMSERPVASSHI